VGTITIKQGCRLVTKESTVRTPLITTSTKIISPKITNFKAINLSYTIPNLENEEIKTSIWSKIEKNKGTIRLTKIREALDSQIPLFTNEDQRLAYVDNKYGLFSTNFWWNILLAVCFVFATSLTIRTLLTFNYGKVLRIRRRKPREEHGETAEMLRLNPEPHENV
jgi:hypothetical protein